VQGRSITREDRDNATVARLYSGRGCSRQFGSEAAHFLAQARGLVTTSKSAQCSTSAESMPRIGTGTMEGAWDAQDQTEDNIEVSQTNPTMDTLCSPPKNWGTSRIKAIADREAELIRGTQDSENIGLENLHSLENLLQPEQYHLVTVIQGNPTGQNHQEDEYRTMQEEEQPRIYSTYSFNASNQDIFTMLRQQVLDNKLAAKQIFQANTHLGMGHLLIEYEEVGRLVERIAPELKRFLHHLYPEKVAHEQKELPEIVNEIPQDKEATSMLILEGADLPSIPQPSEIVRVELKPEKLIKIQQRIDHLSHHTVLARITGCNPGVRQLTMWAKEKLHRSYISFTTRANNYFEIEFDDLAGRNKTLEARYYDLNG
jgi:hypothetical protein